MPSACRIRWMTFCYLLCFSTLLTHGAGAGLAYAQVKPQAVLEAKNILVLHSFEPKAPVFAETDIGLSQTLLDGGVPIQASFSFPLT